MAPHAAQTKATESTPLLSPSNQDSRNGTSPAGGPQDVGAFVATESSVEEQIAERRRKDPTPLPWLQLSVLCLMRVTEPTSFTVIFPFVNQMLHENMPEIPVKQLGYYAGIVESTFAFAQFLTIMFWSRLSDSIGRKPVLLTGLLGSFVSVNCFGLSRSFPTMVAARSIAGLMNGNIAVLHGVLAEVTDDTNQARAFALLPMCFAVGSIVGPTLGGYLAHPVETFPQLFAGWTFLERHPFWLPCFLASLLNALAILLGFFALRETLPKKDRKSALAWPAWLVRGRKPSPLHRADGGEQRRLPSDSEADALCQQRQREEEEEEASANPSIRRLLNKRIVRVLGTQFCLNLLNACHAAILPLFCYETIRHGGVGFSNVDIGTFLAFNGVVGIVNQIIFFPWLERRWGSPIKVYRRVTVFFPLVFACLPLANAVAKAHPHSKVWPATVLAIGTLCKSVANMSMVCSVMLVNNSAPTRNSLGSLNGLSQMFGCLSRTIGPTAVTSLFAFSVSNRVLDGQLTWLVLVVFASWTWYLTLLVEAPAAASWRIKERQAQAQQQQRPESQEQPPHQR